MSLLSSRLSHLPARTRFALAMLFGGGGGALVLTHISTHLRRCRKQQVALTTYIATGAATGNTTTPSRSAKVGVDGRFVRRLRTILKVCMPSITSKEALLVYLQGALLFSRTILSDRIVALEGVCAQNVTIQNWVGFRHVVISLATIAVPAAIVNSAIKAIQILVSLAFRTQLTTSLHKLYMGNRAYYAASQLGGLRHPDQRITDDVEKFCEALPELYSYTFKPVLDIIIFSRSLAQIIGYRGQIGLYVYFIIVAAILRRVSPPIGKMTAEFASLSADLRSAHHRVAGGAEEIAFNDPPAGRAEMQALNRRLHNMMRHSKLTVIQRFVQQCFDGYLVKYTASIIGLIIFAVPLYYTPKEERGATNFIAGRYIRAMRLMMQTSSAMGQLVLVYKRINTLAGYTARVAELLEQVKELGRPQGHLEAFRRVQTRIAGGLSENTHEKTQGDGNVLNGNTHSAGNKLKDISEKARRYPAQRKNGKEIILDKVSMWTPDGSPLVQDLCMNVPEGDSIILLGPNGSGKSSVLRMLAGLWPLQAGSVTLPARDKIFFLSQRPYMYAGSLKEQLMYPKMPGVVIGDNVVFNEKLGMTCLESVQLGSLVTRCGGFDGRLAWDETLSGGEKNRLAVARLLYHKPKFAVLDECTAAVSADGEVVLYKAMAQAGITMLSVAHRKAIMQFHQTAVVLDGAGGWELQKLENGEVKECDENKSEVA